MKPKKSQKYPSLKKANGTKRAVGTNKYFPNTGGILTKQKKR